MTSPQDRIDVEGLKAAAEKATPGGRYVIERVSGACEVRADGGVTIASVFHPPGHTSEEEARFIAAANPAVILELIAQRAALVESLGLMVEIYGPPPYTPVVARARALLTSIQAVVDD